MLNSAQSLDAPMMSQNEFNDAYGAPWYVNDHTPLGNVAAAFGGERTSYGRAYEAYKSNWQNYQNAKAIDEQRKYDAKREDTAYQRMVADLKAAGLNPWLAVQSSLGGVSTNQSSAKKYTTPDAPKKEQSNAGRNVALFMMAAARLIAAAV